MLRAIDSWAEAGNRARKVIEDGRVVLFEDGDGGQDWRNRANPEKRFKRYRVELKRGTTRKPILVGYITQARDFTYRKAGRLITRSWHPLRWQSLPVGRFTPGTYYNTRKDAVRSVLSDYFHVKNKG